MEIRSTGVPRTLYAGASVFWRLPRSAQRHSGLSVRLDDETLRRYADLTDRHSEGRLSANELRELEPLVRRHLQISVLRAEA